MLELRSCFGPRGGLGNGDGNGDCEIVRLPTIHKPSSFPYCRTNPNITRTFERTVAFEYHTEIDGVFYLINLAWCKSYGGIGLSLHVKDSISLDKAIITTFNCGGAPSTSESTNMKPWSKTSEHSNVFTKSWLFGRKKGSKTLAFGPSCVVDAFWDLSNATYFASSPEPLGCFFFALIYNCEHVLLLLGDMSLDATFENMPLSIQTTLISRREHIFGRRLYSTSTKFKENGHVHNILIECDAKARDPLLSN